MAPFIAGDDFDGDVAVGAVVGVGDADDGDEVADGGALVDRGDGGAVGEEFEGDGGRVVVHVHLRALRRAPEENME